MGQFSTIFICAPFHHYIWQVPWQQECITHINLS